MVLMEQAETAVAGAIMAAALPGIPGPVVEAVISPGLTPARSIIPV